MSIVIMAINHYCLARFPFPFDWTPIIPIEMKYITKSNQTLPTYLKVGPALSILLLRRLYNGLFSMVSTYLYVSIFLYLSS